MKRFLFIGLILVVVLGLVIYLFLGRGKVETEPAEKSLQTTDKSLAEPSSVSRKAEMTIVKPTSEGGITIMSVEEKKELQGKKRVKDELSTEPDRVPRKARIAVVPAIYSQEVRSKFERELHEKFGIADPSVIENPGFTGHFVSALVKSRKFDVLERENLRAVTKEIDFGESDYADLKKTIRMGQMLNADYIVIPEVRFILCGWQEKEVPYVGKMRRTYEGRIATNIRVVDVRTSRIASSNIDETTYKEKSERKDLSTQMSQILSFVDHLYAAAALKETAVIIDVVYPIKVISLGVETVTLNRGKGAIEPGEILYVYKPGEVMIDPDTKENLGYSEALVGKVKVIKVKAKVSLAKVLEGTDKIKKYFVCRRAREIEKIEEKTGPKID